MNKLCSNLEDVKHIENELLIDPCISYWLKEQIRESSNRDILDVIKDVELFHNILNLRIQAMKAINEKAL